MIFKISILFLAFALSACAGSDNNFTPGQAALSSASPVASVDPEAPAPTATPPPSTYQNPVVLPPPRASNLPNLKVCGSTTSLAGIDVSSYDPNTNWSQVSNAKAKFAFIKATEGVTLGNRYFASDWQNSKVAGVLRGAYHFFHPNDDPIQQADFYLNTIGNFATSDMPAMFDWESNDNISPAKQVSSALKWLQYVEQKTGKIPVLYTDTSFWNALGNPQGFERYPLFIAHYGVDCPSVPPPWSNWTFWQKGIGPFAGVQATNTDLDVFNGLLSDLLAF